MKKERKKEPDRSERIRLIIFVSEIIATGVIPALLAFWDQMTLSVGVALLVAYISVMFLVSQFMENQFLSEIQEKQDNVFLELSDSINALRKNLDIEDLYKKIYLLKNVEQKEIYLDSVHTFVETMKSRMDGARSGALSRHAYYGELTKASEAIIQDRQQAGTGQYYGEIWAMTFWQDDELDLTDEYENAWVRKMEIMDELGIPTVRLCVMKNKKNLLQRVDIDKVVETFLQRLNYYCKKNAVCKNTIVYAIDSIDTLSAREQEWIGKGFFAIKLSTGDMRLIRGVSLDNRNATTLGGEIDFDHERVEKIRDIWEKLIVESGKKGINQYLWDNASGTIKTKMIDMGFDINNE